MDTSISYSASVFIFICLYKSGKNILYVCFFLSVSQMLCKSVQQIDIMDTLKLVFSGAEVIYLSCVYNVLDWTRGSSIPLATVGASIWLPFRNV